MESGSERIAQFLNWRLNAWASSRRDSVLNNDIWCFIKYPHKYSEVLNTKFYLFYD